MYPSIRHCNQSFKEKMIKEPILKKKKKNCPAKKDQKVGTGEQNLQFFSHLLPKGISEK
jgi:hypothetical protein